jgi:hypothetical protein
MNIHNMTTAKKTVLNFMKTSFFHGPEIKKSRTNCSIDPGCPFFIPDVHVLSAPLPRGLIGQFPGRSSDFSARSTAFPFCLTEQWHPRLNGFPYQQIKAGLQRRARPGFTPGSLFIRGSADT